ncbi:basement membrane-specific heparan sulfate proteoglycan core protein-like isoform X1 [Hermetia illucens]|uniref:basement membrane-specific heparan sulfate proteoglycan core protein-like isoform X1 n=1 Tax=Hermetia illucens TaxID=343691 RepID=UPI0018CC15A7|nr:basement membrane-specific heparan sulfate proteoglycan core protein-like isoform X1 [Hermetia illucens]
MWLEYIQLLGLLAITSSSTGTESWVTTNDPSTIWDSPNIQPFFENSTNRDLIAAVGRTAQLHCKVRNLGDRAVSWIRKRDLHILTIGIMTYTNDQRFTAMHMDDTDEWILKIVSVQPRDTGIYECQVSTEPKISQAYRLTVVVSKAKILANSELFFKSGSDINLTCVTQQAPSQPSYIYWYKDGDLINYSQRGGISVLTERHTKTSKLVIARVTPSDSGNYTCSPSNSNSDSVFVHVIKSEHRAAMQHEGAGNLRPLHLWTSGFLVFLTSYHTNPPAASKTLINLIVACLLTLILCAVQR